MTDGRLQLQKCHSTLDKLKNKIVNLTTSKADINGLIEEYKQFEEPRNVPEMYDEYTSLKADLDKKQEELRKAEEELKMHAAKHEEIRVKFNQQRTLVTSLNGTFETLGRKIYSCAKDEEVLASSRKKLEQFKKGKERELSKVESDIQKAADAVKKTIEERKKVDPKPRIDPTRPHEDIDT
ncbi:uveal autoantigen with coiled-coil domains and ankyrin repeats protein, partial [Parasteatoda tepidariorum]|uniref:uveal autoantigen with coiled-coil domains and ankyrin repeats protein n=1 Tax=Parasteatoda tepidariorum TaxID=114398 RepID=UPI001C720B16